MTQSKQPKLNLASIAFLLAAIILVTITWLALRNPDNLADSGYVAGQAVELSVKNPTPAPELTGITDWINSNPLTLESLKGKVVLIDFWTYSCINCIRTLPYITQWDQTYREDGLVIIGVHAPEFAFEHKIENVQEAVEKYDIQYPVALDNDFSTWRAYNNRYWPAKYFIDATGKLRHTHFGEGDYSESEAVIRQLLEESGATLGAPIVATGDEASPTISAQTPETYLGSARQDDFANSSELVANLPSHYQIDESLRSNEWTLGGDWFITDEYVESAGEDSALRLNFNAKNVYLVMGSDSPLSVTVRLNGELLTPELGSDEDVGENGIAIVSDFRLYRLVNLPVFSENQLLELTVPAGVQLNAFTFASK